MTTKQVAILQSNSQIFLGLWHLIVGYDLQFKYKHIIKISKQIP